MAFWERTKVVRMSKCFRMKKRFLPASKLSSTSFTFFMFAHRTHKYKSIIIIDIINFFPLRNFDFLFTTWGEKEKSHWNTFSIWSTNRRNFSSSILLWPYIHTTISRRVNDNRIIIGKMNRIAYDINNRPNNRHREYYESVLLVWYLRQKEENERKNWNSRYFFRSLFNNITGGGWR